MFGAREVFVPFAQALPGAKPAVEIKQVYVDAAPMEKKIGVSAPTMHQVRIQESCPLSDDYARLLEAQWKQSFPDAAILPVIGLPSFKNKGVVTITHTLGTPPMKINGLASQSPLANNALFSSECSGGKFLNLYEVMLPDTPGTGGGPSRVEIYTRALEQLGLSVAGNHFHWLGAPGMLAIHHQTTSNITPLEFTVRTIRALQAALTMTPLPAHETGYVHKA